MTTQQNMDIRHELSVFKKRIDPEIEKYLDEAIEHVRKEDIFLANLLTRTKAFILAGGKRLRGALLYQGYLLAGGSDQWEKDIMRACVGIELTHAFFLVHDDIMDRDDMRHGVPTLHKEFARTGGKFFTKNDADHFGISMAITAGDLLGAMGNQCIFSTTLPPERVIRALKRLQESISRTGLGQAMDVYMEYTHEVTVQKVLAMYENKTARYTVECPLHLGAILAGAEDTMLATLTQYALPIGTAFQLQDDLLGAFGTSQKTGKAVGADIQEGKMTLLAVKALEDGSKKQQKFLRDIFTQEGIVTDSELTQVQEIFQETGALAYVQEFSEKLIQEGLTALEHIQTSEDRPKQFLEEIAKYMNKRNK